MASVRGQIISGNPSYETVAAQPPPKMPQGPTVIQPAHQEGTTFAPDNHANDKLITRDRHAAVNRGTRKTGAAEPRNLDPIESGEPRPSLRIINRTINFQRGDWGANQDDLTRPFNRDSSGRFLGQQDGSVQPIYGGVPGLWQPYGSYSGYTQGPIKGIQSPVAYGDPHDQPRRIFSGPPHGLHSATFPDYSNTLGRYMSLPQMRGARYDRPDNSRIAGQSYSQTVQPQGQSGTVAIQTSGEGTPRTIGYTPGSAWRGA